MSTTDDARLAVKSARATGVRSAWPFGFRGGRSRTHRGSRWIDRLSVLHDLPAQGRDRGEGDCGAGVEIKGDSPPSRWNTAPLVLVC